MSLRVLLGGVAASFAENNLHQLIAAGTCLSFGPGTALGPADNWDALCSRLPEGWRPDLVGFDLAYHTLPCPLEASGHRSASGGQDATVRN